MKQIILSIIKAFSLVFMLWAIIVLIMTFSNQDYFMWKWKVYLEQKMTERIELLDNSFEKTLWEDSKIWSVLDKFNLTQTVTGIKDNIKTSTEDKTTEIIEKVFEWKIDEIEDITIFWKSLKAETKNVVDNFIWDIRIFLITNIVWFGFIYFLMFYKSRVDIIRNMFYIVICVFSTMILGIIFYIFGQDWITNIVTNNFLGYSYPVLIIIMVWFYIYNVLKKDTKNNKHTVQSSKIESAVSEKNKESLSEKNKESLSEKNNPINKKTGNRTLIMTVLFTILEVILHIICIPFEI